jgi:hypothetical protein
MHALTLSWSRPCATPLHTPQARLTELSNLVKTKNPSLMLQMQKGGAAGTATPLRNSQLR